MFQGIFRNFLAILQGLGCCFEDHMTSGLRVVVEVARV